MTVLESCKLMLVLPIHSWSPYNDGVRYYAEKGSLTNGQEIISSYWAVPSMGVANHHDFFLLQLLLRRCPLALQPGSLLQPVDRAFVEPQGRVELSYRGAIEMA